MSENSVIHFLLALFPFLHKYSFLGKKQEKSCQMWNPLWNSAVETAHIAVSVRILDRSEAHINSACSIIIVEEIVFPSQLLALIGCKRTTFILMVYPLISDVAFYCEVLNNLFQLHSNAPGFLTVLIWKLFSRLFQWLWFCGEYDTNLGEIPAVVLGLVFGHIWRFRTFSIK